MFENFVSLGNACPVAASMEKWGIRSWSGPFDWLITYSLKEVLHCLETYFTEFLLKENLTVMENGQKGFLDIKNGFRYIHDGELRGGGIIEFMKNIKKE